MIYFQAGYSTAQIAHELDAMAYKTPQVLRNAVNDTAKQARKLLATEGQKTYVIKNGAFNRAMKIKRASAAKPTAIIRATGAVTELKDFKVTPAKAYNTAGLGDADRVGKFGYRGKVLKRSSLKPLRGGADSQAFIATMRSGHTSVFRRTGESRLPIKKLLSPSIPTMLGNEKRVYGVVSPEINNMLQANIQKHIAKVLSEGGTK